MAQIRGHIAGSSSPPHCGKCLAFLSREKISTLLSSLARVEFACLRLALSAPRSPSYRQALEFLSQPFKQTLDVKHNVLLIRTFHEYFASADVCCGSHRLGQQRGVRWVGVCLSQSGETHRRTSRALPPPFDGISRLGQPPVLKAKGG